MPGVYFSSVCQGVSASCFYSYQSFTSSSSTPENVKQSIKWKFFHDHICLNYSFNDENSHLLFQSGTTVMEKFTGTTVVRYEAK